MIKNSLIIPIYGNESGIPHLIDELSSFNKKIDHLEVVFVVDGSPDESFSLLKELLPKSGIKTQLILLSKNFGSLAAVRTGLQKARGQNFAVMAADLQEPLELIDTFFSKLSGGGCDVVYGIRNARSDPIFSKIFSNIFWFLYKKLIVPDMPIGGVDVFGCNNAFRQKVLELNESNSSLLAIIFWLGFRREGIGYERLPRLHGKSMWTFKKKMIYLKDSIFSFSNTPIILLTWAGIAGVFVAMTLGASIFYSYVNNQIDIPGYTTTVLVVVFFGGLNLFGLGIIGTYAWRTYENTKKRPHSVIMSLEEFD